MYHIQLINYLIQQIPGAFGLKECKEEPDISGSRNDLGEGLVLQRTEIKAMWLEERYRWRGVVRARWTRAKSYRTFLARGWNLNFHLRASGNHLKVFKLGNERG